MADGNAVNIVNLFIGGCSLERHDRNMQSDETTYEWQYNGQKTDRLVSLRDALRDRAWDVVTLQQASHLSFDKASYEPYLSDLMRFVRQYAPTARGLTDLYRDGFHASLGLGRYALGLLWYRTLTGKTVCGNGFRDLDEPAAEEAIMTVQTAVDSFGV